eukprot:5562876-Pleurochrysis_carterae.AAC.1
MRERLRGRTKTGEKVCEEAGRCARGEMGRGARKTGRRLLPWRDGREKENGGSHAGQDGRG